MTFSDRLKEAFANRIAESFAAAFAVVLAWAAYQISPAILPAIESVVSKRVLLALLVASLALNLAIALVLWLQHKPSEKLRLKYGVYWDKQKNPHCPSCQRPLSAYDNYSYMGRGYLCKPCNQVHALTDQSGAKVEPAQALAEL